MKRLDPMYRLQFSDLVLEPSPDHEKTKAQLAKLSPTAVAGYERLLVRERKRYDRMYPCLQKDYSSPFTMLHPDLLKAIPHLSLGRSMHDELCRYFDEDPLRISFTFQSKYLGMSPWECPAAFMIIPFIEHAFGVWHAIGGLSRISEVMAKVAQENGAKIFLSTPVKQLVVEGRAVKGVRLEDGRQVLADEVIVNADFGYAMSRLVPDGLLRKYGPAQLAKKEFSCSTFMLYLGLKKTYDLPHHTIVFSNDYAKFIQEIAHGREIPGDISFYIRNASPVDPTLAPPGKSNLYVLVPMTNTRSGIVWKDHQQAFRDRVIAAIQEKTAMKDLAENIEVEKVVTPDDWEHSMNCHVGATFNLAHSLWQMLYFRPHNRFEELDHCYLVGGGTHPGSGLPTIYESGRITSNMICRVHGVAFESFNKHV
jgi:phytoene desaturase